MPFDDPRCWCGESAEFRATEYDPDGRVRSESHACVFHAGTEHRQIRALTPEHQAGIDARVAEIAPYLEGLLEQNPTTRKAGECDEGFRLRLARLLWLWKPLDRCVAECDIFYANTGATIAEGRRGTVRAAPHSGVVVVAWDGSDSDPVMTSAENIVPLAS